MMEGISVVVCTFNGRDAIIPALKAIQVQAGLEGIPCEVILVDNASTDDTVALAVQVWTSHSISLRIIREERPGLSFAREAGYEAAEFSILFWVDDDNILHPDYLSRGFQFMRSHPDAAICGGCGEALLACTAPPWLSTHAEAFALGPQGEADGWVPDQRGYVYGAGSILRLEALDELYRLGFVSLLSGRRGSDLTGGEDTEICYALRLLGWRIIQSRNLIFQHALSPHRLTWDYCERLFYGFGKADVIFSLYSLFLRPDTLKHRLQHLFIRRALRKKLRRAAKKDLRQEQAVGGPFSSLELRRHQAVGRIQEAERLERSGELWEYLDQVRQFARRARSIRKIRMHAAAD